MKKLFSKFRIYVLAAFLGFSGWSCNSWLDLLPDNSQTSDMYWNTKEDVEAVVMSTYTSMQGCLEKLVQWGELRGDGLTPSTKITDDELAIVALQILPSNGVCKWNNFYKVIGNANAVIKYAPEVQEKDATFALELMNSYIAEARFMRALAYFYLVRTFGEVPLVTEPYVNDSEAFMKAKSPERAVLDQIIADAQFAAEKCKPGYGVEEQNKGRATMWAAQALLAEVCLWDEQYERALKACNVIINSRQYELVSKDDWYTIFSKGLTKENIFDLTYVTKNQVTSNSLNSWFYSNARYVLSSHAQELFTEYSEDDYRGLGATYLEDRRIWKYSGTEVSLDGSKTRGSESYANWIFYRYADVLLMKAEALIMTGDFEGARDLVISIRERAGMSIQPPVPNNKRDGLEMVMDERLRELAGEGKRWFDILRVAKRHDYEYRDYLLDVVLAYTSAQDRAIYEAKLADTRGYYLPIHKDEITANNGILVQNTYYADLE